MSIPPRPRSSRRQFITRLFQAGGLIFTLLAGSTLFRFLGYRVTPPPRQVLVTRRLLPGMYHQEADFILFVGNDEAWAVSRRCTHLGCTVAFRELERIIECPCHQSRFSPRGQRLAGPAVRDLPALPVETLRDAGSNEISGYQVTIT
ncbi:MAG: hypothetical protein BWK76_05460 [Desulfobulbaceae bacterium A2]|nr:MAG: hypothetical protein BWK76_05460 [Desulfobulbaceae bacterium A2]